MQISFTITLLKTTIILLVILICGLKKNWAILDQEDKTYKILLQV